VRRGFRHGLLAGLAIGAAAGAAAAAAWQALATWEPRPHPPLALAPVLVENPHSLPPVVAVAEPPRPRRRPLERAREGEPVRVELTAYCLKGTTRRGRYVREGIVAADPRIFPLSRYVEIFVDGRYYGRFLVDDTGSKIKGPIIDVWKESCADALTFGRRRGTAVLVPRRASG
jgi:3D (Asp-Asp-Asp) domain-containing protein